MNKIAFALSAAVAAQMLTAASPNSALTMIQARGSPKLRYRMIRGCNPIHSPGTAQ